MALETLQSILESRHVVPDDGPADAEHPEHPWDPKQDTLPLLEEVVVPGAVLDDETTPPSKPITPAEPMAPVPPYTDLLSRLASELDVIIESCVDEALDQAKQEMMAQIKHHLDIVLPEMLDELIRRQDEDQDFSR